MLSEQLNLFGERPQSPRPPAKVKVTHEPPAKEQASEEKVDKVERALAAVIMPDKEPDSPVVALHDNPAETEILPVAEDDESADPASAESLPVADMEILAVQHDQEEIMAITDSEESAANEIAMEEPSAEVIAVEEPTAEIFTPGDSSAEAVSVEVESVEDNLPQAETFEQADESIEPSEAEVVVSQQEEESETFEVPAETVTEAQAAEKAEEPEAKIAEAEAIPAIDWSKGELNIPPDRTLFQRQYYTMRETTGMFGLTHAQLRSWENEFDVLQPRKNRKGDRYFRPVDIKNLELIYYLLRKRRFTPDGAKAYLKNNKHALDNFGLIQKLEGLKGFLHELKSNL